jgi:WD40 repeat protein
VKQILHLVTLVAVLLVAACSGGGSPPQSTAVPPTLPSGGDTAVTAGKAISAANASQLQAVNRATVEAPQGMAWRADSSAVLVYTSGSVEELPALPDTPLGRAVASLPEGERIAAVTAMGAGVYLTLMGERELRVRDLTTSEVLQTIQEDAPVSATQFAPDGSRALIQRLDKIAVRVISVPDGALIKELRGFETAAPVYSARFSADGKSLIWTSRATAQVMDLATGASGTRIERPEFIGAVALLRHSDGATLATAEESQLHLWDAASGRELRVVPLPAPGAGMALSPDMSLIVVATSAGLQILDASLMAVGSLPGNLRQVSFSPDGSALATIDEAGDVVVWKVPG